MAIRRVCEYIDAHFARNLSLSALSEIAGLSPFHLARAFERKWDIRRTCISKRGVIVRRVISSTLERRSRRSPPSLSDEMRQVFFVLVADELQQIGVGRQLGVQLGCPDPGVRLRIVDR